MALASGSTSEEKKTVSCVLCDTNLVNMMFPQMCLQIKQKKLSNDLKTSPSKLESIYLASSTNV